MVTVLFFYLHLSLHLAKKILFWITSLYLKCAVGEDKVCFEVHMYLSHLRKHESQKILLLCEVC